MSFKRHESLSGAPVTRRIIIDNSDDVQVGDAVKGISGNLEVVTAADALLGVIIDIVDRKGKSIWGTTALVGSATVTGIPTTGTVTVASDNETVDKIAALIDISMETVYSVSVTGTIGTTVSSDKWGAWVDTVDEKSIDETTATRTIGTGGQFITQVAPDGTSKDPDDSTRLLVSIHESEYYGLGKLITA